MICGAGVNAAGIAPDGRTARLAALGEISGDWGGGTDVGWRGSGPRSGRATAVARGRSLERARPAHFGFKRPREVTLAFEYERMPETRVRELSPVVFGAARDGDAVARAIIDRLADEVAVMAAAIIRQLHLTRRDVEVTLAGGVFAPRIRSSRLDRGRGACRGAAGRVHRLDAPPVLGAALRGLDGCATRAAERRRPRGGSPGSAGSSRSRRRRAG